MKYCSKCGTQLEDDALFCANCGSKQGDLTNNTGGNIIDEIDEKRKKPVLLKTIQCIGTTVFNMDRKLYIYDNRITLMKDTYETLFDCNFRDIAYLKNGGVMAITFMSLVLKDGTVHKFKLNGNDPSMVKVAKELPEYVAMLKRDYCERNNIVDDVIVQNDVDGEKAANNSLPTTPKISAPPKTKLEVKKDIPLDKIFKYSKIILVAIDVLLCIVLVFSVISKTNRMKEAEIERAKILQKTETTVEQKNDKDSEQGTVVTSDEEKTAEETKNDTEVNDNEVLTGVNTYVGTIHKDGLSCYLELEQDISYLDPLDEEPITSNIIWFSESEAKEFVGYDGLTATLEGELFNYRGSGDLMFDGMPSILSVSGTPKIAEKSASYKNWSTASNETKFNDSMEILRTIIFKCPDVWDVRTLTDMDVIDSINANGFTDFNAVMLQVNGNWADSLGLECYITPYEDHINICLGPNDAPSIPLWKYDWNGEFISGDMPLEDYIKSCGLAD